MVSYFKGLFCSFFFFLHFLNCTSEEGLFKLDFFSVLTFPFYFATTEMLVELARREKEANIKPDPDVDIYMKVGRNLLSITTFGSSSTIFFYFFFIFYILKRVCASQD